jgi:hypothetical protein
VSYISPRKSLLDPDSFPSNNSPSGEKHVMMTSRMLRTSLVSYSTRSVSSRISTSTVTTNTVSQSRASETSRLRSSPAETVSSMGPWCGKWWLIT